MGQFLQIFLFFSFIYIYKYIYIYTHTHTRNFPHGSDGKASACKVEDLGSIPESGRSPGEGNSNPLQNSYLENPMDRGTW